MFLLAVFCIFILSACTDNSADAISEGCVRIHIRANSNAECDQDVKLFVRDNIVAYLQDELKDCKSKSEALQTIEERRGVIKQIADNTLYNNGYTYSSAVTVKKESFPERTYDAYTFPEGIYDALIIELGSGRGDNWWCVAFPPLCFIPDSGDGENIVYKSWVKEMLDKIFA